MEERLSSGIEGLDEILHGGFLRGRAYLVRGGPGTGKTTLGWYFLRSGVDAGEPVLLISLGEPVDQMRHNAARLGLDLGPVETLDLAPTPEYFVQVESYDIFTPAEVELEPTTKTIVDTVNRVGPRRVFVDSMTQLRYFSRDPFQYRKQVLSFLRFLIEKGATVLFTSEGSLEAPDTDLQFLADGVIDLELRGRERTLEVTKFRGSSFEPGRHCFRLDEQGMRVFPRLVPEAFGRKFAHERVSSGIPELDAMLGGGIVRGTVTLISGPSGVGKTTVGLHFLTEAARRGERAAHYLFEEDTTTALAHGEAVGLHLRELVDGGRLRLMYVEPLRYTPDEFARIVRHDVEEGDVRTVMIDSMASYRLAMRGEDPAAHLHALCRYLTNMGVTVLVVDELTRVTGDFQVSELGLSFVGDAVIFLRYLEIGGELRRAIGVLKMRYSDFEKTLREFAITEQGVRVGPPLHGLRGILTGTPELQDPGKPRPA
ncbi:MAG: AAA family ATPase [candidate division KSB1 bacterium]|nr:AAA family ATPase [candidate division KSB1 bacterium]